MAEHMDDGSISPSGRFARMEAALDRIEAKLDQKADVARVVELEIKIAANEKYISDVVSGNIMSPSAASLVRRFEDMERSMEILEKVDSNRQAVAEALKASTDLRYRILMWGVGITAVLNFSVSVFGKFVGL